MSSVLRHLCRAAIGTAEGGLSDARLLESFLTGRDEAAFTALVWRHGPMVLGVCRRVLRNAHDAEDAFQATFLVLARKAGSIRARELLAPWLYGVAYRTAMKARAMNARRRLKERAAGATPRPPAVADDTWDELLERLDGELSRLPEKYRVPVVLCELQGKSRKEAAALLGVPEGTLSWRLAQARKQLARALSRSGVALPAGALVAASAAGVPPALLAATARVGTWAAAGETVTAGAVPARVLALAEGVVKTMLLRKLKVVGALALAVCVGAGAVGLGYRTGAAEPPQPGGDTKPETVAQRRQPGDAPAAARGTADELEALRLEIEALRKGLQATRERVKTLETEVQALRVSPTRQGGFGGSFGGSTTFSGGALGNFSGGALGFTGGTTGGSTMAPPAQPRPKPPEDPLAEAEAALKKLRQDPGDKQAVDALERALKGLKERPKAKDAKPNEK
jgi:RNA polymerase sigma factor (sigma-70 family)